MFRRVTKKMKEERFLLRHDLDTGQALWRLLRQTRRCARRAVFTPSRRGTSTPECIVQTDTPHRWSIRQVILSQPLCHLLLIAVHS